MPKKHDTVLEDQQMHSHAQSQVAPLEIELES